MREGIAQRASGLLPPALAPADPHRHIPASHPVLQRGQRIRMHDTPQAIEVRPEKSGRGLGPHAWQYDLVVRIETLVEQLDGAFLPPQLRDRYERALTRGHADNLRRVRSTEEE